MTSPIVYDLTRLSSRVLNGTPNGIDRIDMAFARRMFSGDAQRQGLAMTSRGLRLLSQASGQRLVSAIKEGWGEFDAGDEPAVMAEMAAFLDRSAPSRPVGFPATRQLRVRRKLRLGRLGDVASTLAFPGPPAAAAPKGAIYLNISQFPLWLPFYFRWLRERPDIAIVPAIHDLIPLEYPEYFRRGEFERHRQRLAFVAERASAVLVATELTKAKLLAEVAKYGRKDLPVHVAGLPVEPIFETAAPPDPRLQSHPYFMVTGTIEPRKNHLLLLQVWRRMVEELGSDAPKLVIVGRRGWENENVLDLLERSHLLRNHVLEVFGLSSGSMRALMAGARALLLPTFSEGYGYPLIEARAAGTPVIASDIEVFREIGVEATYADPLDGLAWKRAVLNLAGRPRESTTGKPAGGGMEAYFAEIESFLETISARSI